MRLRRDDFGGQGADGEGDEPFDLGFDAGEAFFDPPAPVVIAGSGVR